MKTIPMFKTLDADPVVKGLLGRRIYEDLAPTDTPTPYLVWQEISGTAENSLDCAANVDHIDFQVLIYDPYQVTAANIRTEVCRVLEKYCVVDKRLGHYESATKLYARGFQAAKWLDR